MSKYKIIKWTPEEWAIVAARMLEVHPAYLDDPTPTIQAGHLSLAMTPLPISRWRPVPTHGGLAHFRAGFVIAFNAIRLERGLPPLSAADTKPGKMKAKVFWTKAEFLKLARELHRLHPGGNFLYSTSLSALHIADINMAQRVLPEHRHRDLHALTGVRHKFLAAFKELKVELVQLREKREDIAKNPERYAAPIGALPITLNPYEAAFAPLVELLTDAVFARLLERVGSAPIAGGDIGAPAAAAGATKIDIAGFMRDMASAVRPIKRKIGVAGANADQANELRKSFPQFEFIIKPHDKMRGSEAVSMMRSADRVIGMTSFMNHPVDAALAGALGTNYRRVAGGVSAIKRTINLWISSGELV